MCVCSDTAIVHVVAIYKSTLLRILTYGVEYLEKKGDYRQATEILELLLSQTKYGISQRGHWLERLTLNLDFHLKEKNKVYIVLHYFPTDILVLCKCLEVIQSAMEESGLHPARQLSLIQRAHKLCNVTSSKLKVLIAFVCIDLTLCYTISIHILCNGWRQFSVFYYLCLI